MRSFWYSYRKALFGLSLFKKKPVEHVLVLTDAAELRNTNSYTIFDRRAVEGNFEYKGIN